MPVFNNQDRSDHVPFASTRWSLVVAAGQESSPSTQAALESLCAAYWYPLYAFARRRGYQCNDAMDSTQAFFATLLEKDYLATADREKGRFRSFLLTMFKRFLSKEHERETAQKRGGAHVILSFDVEKAEARYRLEPHDLLTPERVFERRWATTLLDRALGRLEEEFVNKQKADVFQSCRVFLTGSAGAPAYSEIAETLGMTEGAVKVTVHRLRSRFREILKAEVAETVADNGDIDDELRALLEAVRR